jgi:hypothetical protein
MLTREILPVALKYGIVTRHTAFVAVEHTTSVSGERITIVQPVEMPAMWENEGCSVSACMAPQALFDEEAVAGPYDAASMEEDSAGWFDACRSPLPSQPAPRMRRAAGWQATPSAPPTAFAEHAAALHASRDPRRDVESQLSLSQRADGSWDGDVTRTAALLVVLIVLGHSRRVGSRRRVVQKAATWLAGHQQHQAAAFALALLDRVETGGALPRVDELARVERELRTALGDEGWLVVRDAAVAV